MSKYKLDKSAQIVENSNYTMTQEEVCERLNTLEEKLAEMTEKYNACQEARKLEIEFNQQDKAQLKQQLAEKEKEISEYVEIVDDLHKQLSDKCDFCEEGYKKQLAEKEKEISELKRIGEKGHLNDLFEDKRKENKILIKAIEQANQDKISFAVEQLEKVKEEFDCIYSNDTYTPYQIADKIDNQIKQLKEK